MVHEYGLMGPQVEPRAGYWMFCAKLRIVSIKELTAVADKSGGDGFFPPYPDPCSQPSKGTGNAPAPNNVGMEVDNMADNIGLGRMSAGIHWRSEQENGMELGRTVARLVLRQLMDMGIDFCPPERKPIKGQCDPKQTVECDMSIKPPPIEQLEKEAKQFEKDCDKKKPKQDPCARPPQPMEDSLDANRGGQQGGQ